MRSNQQMQRWHSTLAIVALGILTHACTLLFAPANNENASDGGPDSDGTPSFDGGPNLTDHREVYGCDQDTLVLLHFDGEPWNALSCSGCQANEFGSTVEREAPSSSFGSARGITGTSYLDVNNNCLEPVSAFTVEAWVRPDLIGGDERFIAFLGPSTTMWSLHLDLEGYVVASKGNRSCAPVDTVTSVNPMIIGRWHHIRYTYDGQQMRLFLDGIEEASMRATDPDLCLIDTSPLIIGARVAGAKPLVGAIDEFRYSSSVRDSAD